MRDGRSGPESEGERDSNGLGAENNSLPERIGIYRVEGYLGAGGMGEVYLAHDDRLDRPVAIKRIRHDVEATSERRERLRREAQAVAKLSHPAVVQIHDVVYDDDSDAIVMERVPGESLDRLMHRGGFEGVKALDLARQIAEGLEAAHQRGLVHRDLKAENVMVTPDGKAKILDFGLVKDLKPLEEQGLTADGMMVGTSRSMSPEQALGLPVDSRSDLFSFGVLCYELFTGHSPFRGGNVYETIDNVTRNQAPPPKALRPQLPAELSDLIERLLEKDPGRRPATTTEVLEVFQRLAERGDLAALAAPGTGAPGSGAPGSGAPGSQPFGEASPSTAPTGSWIRSSSAAETVPAMATTKPFPVSAPPTKRRDLRWLTAGLVLLVALAFWNLWPAPEAEEISVLLPRVEIVETTTEGPDEAMLLLAAGVRAASLGTLSSLSRVSVIEPHRNSPEDELEAARSEAADQILRAEIMSAGGFLARVNLQRIAAADGSILASKDLEISSLPQHAREAATLLHARILELFAEYPPPKEDQLFEVSDNGYRVFLELRKRADRGETFDRRDLQSLEAVLEESPRFLAGFLFAAFMANTQNDYDLASELAAKATELAPRDPRTHYRRFSIELNAGRMEEALQAVEELERVAPGDILTLVARASYLERQGHLAEARDLQRTVVDLRPSWQNLYRLADLEYTLGEHEAARAHLHELFERSPKNARGLDLLARLELFFGDLEAAENIYRELITADPADSAQRLGNLGLARYLLGRFDAAVESYRLALRQDHGGLLTRSLLRLNLANALDGRGDQEEARELWEELLADLRAERTDTEPGAYLWMVEAECLARLGSPLEAIEITQQTLQRFPQSSQISYLAALVYSLVGDRNHTLIYSAKALAEGTRPRWFSIPAFDPLAGDPELEALLASAVH